MQHTQHSVLFLFFFEVLYSPSLLFVKKLHEFCLLNVCIPGNVLCTSASFISFNGKNCVISIWNYSYFRTFCEIAINNDSQKLPKDFQTFLGNSINKMNLVNYLFRTWIITFPKKLAIGQLVFLANLDGTVHMCTSEQSVNLTWFVIMKRQTQKCLFCVNILLISITLREWSFHLQIQMLLWLVAITISQHSKQV